MQIPEYPEQRALRLDDKPVFDDLLQRLQPRISELTFAGLYLFRIPHAYGVTRIGHSIIILGQGYSGKDKYFLPPLSGNRIAIARLLLAQGHTLYGADELFLGELAGSNGISASEDRGNFDYLYHRRDLAELPGNRYHKKKNRVNYFTTRHLFTVEPFRDDFKDGCIALVDDWVRVHGTPAEGSLAAEAAACREAVAVAGVLELEGVVVLVAGQVRAFALGERLNADTSVCHFQKADPFLDGLYQLLDREFNLRLFTDCLFVNKEQDLGEPNLRTSKLSYHPVELVKKYRVCGKVTEECSGDKSGYPEEISQQGS